LDHTTIGNDTEHGERADRITGGYVMTSEQIVSRELMKAARTDYGKRHVIAWNANAERLPELIGALGAYADAYTVRNGSKIGTDGVLGRYWCDIARGILGLLNGELGGLDGALTDKTVRAITEANGVDTDTD